MMPATGRDPSLEDFTAFTTQFGYVVTNALGVHLQHMLEAAQEADENNAPAYARVFRESADRARRALDAWLPLADEDVPLI